MVLSDGQQLAVTSQESESFTMAAVVHGVNGISVGVISDTSPEMLRNIVEALAHA